MAFFRCNSVAAMHGAEATPDYERRGLWWERPFERCPGGKVISDPQLPVDFCARCGGAVGEQRK